MADDQKELTEVLSSANTVHSQRTLVEELIDRGISPAEASQQLLEALSSGVVLEHSDDQIYLDPKLRRGW